MAVIVLCLFLTVPSRWVGLSCLIVALSGHSQLFKTHGELDTGERLLHSVLLKTVEFAVKRFCMCMHRLFWVTVLNTPSFPEYTNVFGTQFEYS